MKSSSPYLLSAMLLAAFVIQPEHCFAQEKLPSILKSNNILVGQLYGCVSRVELYAKMTAQQPDAKFKPEDSVKVASSVLSLDVKALKSDLVKLQFAFPTADDVRKFDVMMEKIATAEFNDKAGLSWAQSASCAVLLHNLGLYDKYPPEGK